MLFWKNIFIIILLVFLASCGANVAENTAKNIESAPLPDNYEATLDEAKKVELARERRKEQTQIRKGDYMMSKNNPTDALGFYLPLLEKLPDDVVLYRKIASVYFDLQDWERAYSYFVRVPIAELTDEEKNEMILSLFYREDAIDATREIQKLSISSEDKIFYNLMIQCYQGIKMCADGFWNYQGEDARILAFQKIVKDSYKVTPDEQYRNMLIAKELYLHKMYRLVGMITSEILANDSRYLEAKKMRAFALYELGKYQNAIDLMLEYFEKNPEDMEIVIRLGEAYTHTRDYVSANLYFNNAISAGYSPKTILERRMAYNYAQLGDMTGMISVLGYLLQEEDVAEDDFAVGITLAIAKWDIQRAYSWAYQGIKKFPNSKILVPMYIQTLRLSKKNTDAMVYMSGLSEENKSLPMVQLEKGILLFDLGQFSDAKAIFEELKNYDETLDFGIEATAYLARIEEEEKRQKELEMLSQSGNIMDETEVEYQGDDFWK